MLNREEQIDAVFYAVQQLTTVPRGLIVRKTRKRTIVRARAMVAMLLRDVLHLTTVEVAQILGRSSHSSIVSLTANGAASPTLSADVGKLSITLRAQFWPEVFALPEPAGGGGVLR